jgi:hypothetical protein
LQIARPKDATPVTEPASPAPAPETAAVPRLAFARKKAAEVVPPPAPAPVPVEAPALPRMSGGSGGLPLKRPPPGSRLFPAHELAAPDGAMPAPLTPVTRGATSAPFPTKTNVKSSARSHTLLLALIGVLVLIIGGMSAYILMQDEKVDEVIKSRPPMVIGSTPPVGKPIEGPASGSADSPAAKFLQTMPIDFVDAGASPKLSVGGQVYQPGQVVDKATGLKWVMINDKARQLEFVDGQGLHYIKKF